MFSQHNFVRQIQKQIMSLLNKTNELHIYCIFFRFMQLHVSVLGDHPQGAHCYRVHQCYHVQSRRYQLLCNSEHSEDGRLRPKHVDA
jgi:hypothetical protein